MTVNNQAKFNTFLKNKKQKEVKFENICPDDFFKLCKLLKVKTRDMLEVNGWECDYNETIYFKKENFIVSGSAWYGTVSVEREL